MKAGVCSYCFNKLFLDNKIDVPETIRFVGTETDADCYEPLSRYWDPDCDEYEQAREAKDLMDEVGLTASCYTLDSDFAVYDDEAASECVTICIQRLETAKLLGANSEDISARLGYSAEPELMHRDNLVVLTAADIGPPESGA